MVSNWNPSFTLEDFPGVSTVYLRLFHGPTIAMPLKEDDGQRRYKIGQITLKPKDA